MGMQYYHIWVKSVQYRGSDPLTYCYKSSLDIGSIVEVELRAEIVLGVVVAVVKRPSFETKPIRGIFKLPPLPESILELAYWLQKFYPSPVGVITQQLLPRLRMNSKTGAEPSPIFTPAERTQPALTNAQSQALNTFSRPDTYLLHGRTGSGKTRIYIELASQTLSSGRSALVLSPEIGLTSQLASQFQRLFGHDVIILHSQLTDKQRERAWSAILRSTAPLIVIGPRSALFSPIANLGLIVVDECHDVAYKQGQPPYYHAVRVASKLRAIHDAILVLGSATPSVSDYYLATSKQKKIVRLDRIAKATQVERNIIIVDVRDRSAFRRAPHLSSSLIEAMAASLGQHEQVLLYLNRRGTARAIVCDQCGWQAICQKCGIALTFHGDEHRLICHVCGNSRTVWPSCPECGNASIIFRGVGTKAIVDEAQGLFPESRIARFDTDNKVAERLERRYEQILSGEFDILVGTQMLAKGLDLPRLSTLGVIAADSSLALPDYTAAERTYQLINQVVGRVGRGHLKSSAIIQTFRPDSPLLKSALDNNWDSFYNMEIKQRNKYNLPPFSSILKLTCRRSTSYNAQKTASALKHKLDSMQLQIDIEGPAAAFREKVGDEYQWQLIIKAHSRSELLKVIDKLPTSGWTYDIDPVDLL